MEESNFKKGIPKLVGFGCYDENGKFTHLIPNKSAPMETAIRTKEAILKSTHSSNVMNWQKVFEQNPLIIESAYESMDSYAQQQSIEFAQWILSEKILSRDTNWFDAGKHYTSSELYQLFISSKSAETQSQ